MSTKPSFTVFIINSLIIIGVMVLSGKATELTLYDRFLIRMEGVEITVSDRDRSVRFYLDVLNFAPIREKNARMVTAFRLPDGRKLFIKQAPVSPSQASANQAVACVIRVRNGIEKLNAALVRRSGKKSHKSKPNGPPPPPATVGELVEQPWGKEFVVSDLDNNRMVFFLPRKL